MNKCKECEVEVGKRNKFCSSSCAAKFNNRLRIRKAKPDCPNCNVKLSNHQKTYCSNKCQGEYQYKIEIKPRFDLGAIQDRNTLRRILNKENGSKCSICLIEDWNNAPIVFEVDHINGDASNNLPENLRLVCPNCHSQTEFYKGRNRGNGRISRGYKK